MNFSKKFLRVVSLVLMVLILIPGMPSFAATFKDVNSSHWAYSYIEKMVKEGYIKGDPDGNFRPDLPSGSLSYLEVLTFVSRIIDLTVSEKQTIKSKYQTIVNKNGVPEWAQEAVMICLFKGVISESELEFAVSKGMIKTGTTGRVGRLSTSIYLGKAMGLEELANSKPFVSLSFKDLLSIDTKYHKLIYTLIEAGVLDPKGTGDGNFEPLGFVSRSQMAKMLSTAHDYLQKNPPIVTPEPEPVVTTEVINGVLTKITNLGTNTFLSVKTKANTEIAYLVDSKTTIKLDNKTTTISSLFEGQDIKVTITKGTNAALSVEAESVEEEITGTIKNITPASNKLVVEYIKDKATKTAELTVSKSADITLDGIDADLYDLKIGDEVNLFTENNVVVELDATAKSGEVEGIIVDLGTEVVSKETVYFVTIENSKGVKTEYELDEDVSIYKDGRRSDFEDLKLGDEAVLELEYGLVVDIEADMVEKEIEGFITAISTRLNSGTEITIKNRETDKEETYLLARNAIIKVDGTTRTTFYLNVGYFVEVVVGGNEIVELYADSVGSEYMVRGKITSINSRKEEIVLDVINSEINDYQYGDEITIKLSDESKITEGNSSNLPFSELGRGMTVYVFGNYDGYSFIANEINIR